MNLKPYVRTAKSVITANSPVLLLGTTIAGVVTTGVLAAKAGWTARGRVENEIKDRFEASNGDPMDLPLTWQEIAQLTWQEFTLPVISGAGTIAAAVGTHTIHTKRANAMAALYAVTSNQLDDMTERAEELLGPKKAQKLRDELAQKQVDERPLESDSQILMIGDGTEICYDEWSGRYFMSSIPALENAINELNREILNHDDASLNNFYEFVGLPLIRSGENFGWSGAKVEGRFGSVVTKDGRPAISVSFRTGPSRI